LPGDHKKEKLGIPPITESTVAVPLFKPQVVGSPEEYKKIGSGWFNKKFCVALQNQVS